MINDRSRDSNKSKQEIHGAVNSSLGNHEIIQSRANQEIKYIRL